MNCLEFRRICLSDPGNGEAAFVGHRDVCEDCGRYAESVSAMDERLGVAMRVPVPGDLTTRIKLRQVIRGEQFTRRVRPLQIALAASVVVAVTLGTLFGYQVHTSNRYAARLVASAVDHTRMEQQGNHFVTEREPAELQQQRFKQVLAAFGGRVMDSELASLGEILHVQVCALESFQGPVAHAVLKGERGEVTVYYVIGRKLRAREEFEQGRFKGLLVPVGQGSMAIVGAPDERLVAFADRLEQAIAWHI